jgi:NDP-sugar pyrophosphorylase family protein
MIKEYLNELNYNTKYIEEEDFLGTAGSIGLLDKKEFNKSFFVSNCDILLNIDFLEPMMIHEKENIDITIFASLENNDISYGVIEIDNDGNYIRIKEKPNSSYLANTGIYILKPKIINIVKENEVLDMPNLIQRAKNKGMKIKIFTVPHKMTDVGQWEYYKKFIDLK